MNQNEATWIAISALQWVISSTVFDPNDPSDQEHLTEKKEALELLLSLVK